MIGATEQPERSQEGPLAQPQQQLVYVLEQFQEMA